MKKFNTDIANYLKAEFYGKKLLVRKINSFPNKDRLSISFYSKKLTKNVPINEDSTVITKKTNYKYLKDSNVSAIFSDFPKYDLARVLNKFFKKKIIKNKDFKLGKECKIGKNFYASNGVIIEDNVKIGNNVHIGYNSIIKSNVTIQSNVLIQSGAVIGAEAFSFGYNKDSKEKYLKVPSSGGVLIEEGSQIGNNCVIQRGLIENTIIRENVKINDLSNIGNSVLIGENSLIMANVYLSGRVKIGESCWIAPNVSILQGVEIGNNTQIGIGSVVTKDVPEEYIAYGNPAKNIRKRDF